MLPPVCTVQLNRDDVAAPVYLQSNWLTVNEDTSRGSRQMQSWAEM
jgi:hypothetical protein